MRNPVFIFACGFVFMSLFPVFLSAQSEYLDNGVSGTGLSVNSYWESVDFKSVGLTAAYSLAGILDLGLGVNIAFGQLNNDAATELSGYILYNVFVLKQDHYMPLSVQITGSYGLTNVSSEFLDDNDLIKRGSGFTIGARILRDFELSSGFGIQPGLFFNYRSYRFMLESVKLTAPAATESTSKAEVEENLYYGFVFSLFYKSSYGGPVISTTFEGTMDLAFNIRFGPRINITMPIRAR